MGILKNLTQLSENLGAGTADFSDLLAEQTRLFSCSLWNSFPDKITNNSNLAGSFTRGFMNRMCADQSLPPPPVIPFTGGQCDGIRYTVRIRWLFNNGSLYRLLTFDVWGPIQSIFGFFEPGNPSDPNGPGLAKGEVQAFTQTGQPMLFENDGPEGGPPPNPPSYEVVRFDGLPDTCGNPDSSYPETNPDPNIDYVTNVIINSEDGGTLTFPLIYTPIDFSFPLNFDLGGINLTIDLGGINFNFSLVSIDGLPIPLPDGQDAPLPSPRDDPNRNIRCRRRPSPNGSNYNQDDKSETDPKEENIGDTLEFVRVTLTSVPTNVKNQFGDGAPDVIYAGWFEFQGEGFNFPRQPIHFTNSLFIPPEGATGYAYTLYQGIQGKATVYTTKEDT